MIKLIAIISILIFIIISRYEMYPGLPIVDPQLLKMKNLEKKLTSPRDIENTKRKKMIGHFINKLKEDINSSGDFLKGIFDATKPNGCIDYSTISTNLFGSIIQDFNPDAIKSKIGSSLNEFKKDYSYLIKKYYKIPDHLINKSKISIKSNPGNKPQTFKDYYLFDLKNTLKTIEPKYSTTQIVVYHPDAIINMIKRELDRFNFDDFPVTLTKMVQDLDKEQCKRRKICCV